MFRDPRLPRRTTERDLKNPPHRPTWSDNRIVEANPNEPCRHSTIRLGSRFLTQPSPARISTRAAAAIRSQGCITIACGSMPLISGGS